MMRSSRSRRWSLPLTACAAAAALALPLGTAAAGATPGDASERPDGLRVTNLSGPPDMVTGGTALVEVEATTGVPLDQIRVSVNDEDVTDAFEPATDRTLTGVVSDLELGENEVAAGIAQGRPQDTLTLRNHPIEGPLFAGPHQEPFICDTASFQLAVGGTLGEPLDENCTAHTRVDYLYRTTGDEFEPLPDSTTRPSDLTWTTTSSGEEVPYIVRVETGTINRAIYEIAMLHDPRDEVEPDPWTPPLGWNDRLIYKFGGGCTTGWYVQGRNTGGVLDDGMLAQGYAVASSSLNVFGNNCNDLLAAESMAMVKEHFVTVFGPPKFTLGWGSSGGAYQSHQISDNYPGLLDGILVAASFPDVGFGTVHTISDAWLLHHYFTETAPEQLTQEQERAIAGFGRWDNIEALANRARRIDPRPNCKSWVPEELRYDPETNPEGARCDVYSAVVNVYGKDPDTHITNRPLDNVGIQYGLEALEDGTINVDQFLDLNEGIGGFDGDANIIPERTEANLGATAAAYRSGRLLNGGGGLADIPIVDFRAYADDHVGGDIHLRFHGFSTRERLRKANGTADNHVMLVANGGGLNSRNRIVAPALAELDAWVTAIQADTEPANAPIDKIRRNRPDWLEDSCWRRDNSSERLREPQLPLVGGTPCADDYPVWPSPRMVAGGPIENDVVKCQRKPFDASDYDVEFTAAQRARAEQVFADGVCDWSKPGVEQQGLAGTWLRF